MRIFKDGKSGAEKVQSIAVMQDVKTYWDGLCDNDPVPFRSDVDPRNLQKVLKHSFILERIAPGLARLRVSCNTLGDLMGMDMRGMPMSALIDESSREGFSVALEKVFNSPAIGRLELSTGTGFRRPEVSAEMMLLPLRSDTGEVNRILGAITYDGNVTDTPRRLKLVGSFLRRIEMPEPQKASPQQNRTSVPHKFEIATPRTNISEALKSQTVPTRHSHLRVVVSDT